MGLIKNIIEVYKEQETMNQRLAAAIPQLPSTIREQIRLLTRQFRIIEIYASPPDFEGVHLQRNQWVIKFQNYETGEIFEWTDAD